MAGAVRDTVMDGQRTPALFATLWGMAEFMEMTITQGQTNSRGSEPEELGLILVFTTIFTNSIC